MCSDSGQGHVVSSQTYQEVVAAKGDGNVERAAQLERLANDMAGFL